MQSCKMQKNVKSSAHSTSYRCPLCCCTRYNSREELRHHLIKISSLLNNLQCKQCLKTFLTLQDYIEHLKILCIDKDGKPLARNDDHITYVDCGAISKFNTTHDNAYCGKQVLKHLKNNNEDSDVEMISDQDCRNDDSYEIASDEENTNPVQHPHPVPAKIFEPEKKVHEDKPFYVYVKDNSLLLPINKNNNKTTKIQEVEDNLTGIDQVFEPVDDVPPQTCDKDDLSSNIEPQKLAYVKNKEGKYVPQAMPYLEIIFPKSSDLACKVKTSENVIPKPTVSPMKSTHTLTENKDQIVKKKTRKRSALKSLLPKSFVSSENGKLKENQLNVSTIQDKTIDLAESTHIENIPTDSTSPTESSVNQTDNISPGDSQPKTIKELCKIHGKVMPKILYMTCRINKDSPGDNMKSWVAISEKQANVAGVDRLDLQFACLHCDSVCEKISEYLNHDCANDRSLKKKVTKKKVMKKKVVCPPGHSVKTICDLNLVPMPIIQYEKTIQSAGVVHTVWVTETEDELRSQGLHNAKLKFVCGKCEQDFTFLIDYLKHKCKFECIHCSRIYLSIALLEQHKQSKHRYQILQDKLNSLHPESSTTFYCDKCKLDVLIELAEAHTKVHDNGEFIYKCTDCTYLALGYHQIMDHIKNVHYYALMFVCKACHKDDMDFEKLKKHLKDDHKVDYKHPNCSMSLDDEHLLSVPINLPPKWVQRKCQIRKDGIAGEQDFPCQYCENSYKNTEDKYKHENTHKAEKMFVCNMCDKNFSSLQLLRYHIRTHIKLKAYPCHYCDKRFISASNRRDHMITMHTTARTVKCNLCDKAFKSAKALLSHSYGHTKSISCPDCGRKFSSNTALKCHKKIIHGSKTDVYDCMICSGRFGNAYSLKVHLKTHYKIGLEEEIIQKMVAVGSKFADSEHPPNPPSKRIPKPKKKKKMSLQDQVTLATNILS